ncbi:MAG: TetR family transcriptional regulator [Coriobacteriales bacterium]|jgi:AcrR family transcriptional regulator|nr:TetR family transcriptional regulator [Coriobacteriales bacterium]
MSDACHTFTAALRTLLVTTPYYKVTVQDLCDAAFLSRRTFYKHFQNKDSVVRAMVNEDFIEPPTTLRTIMDVDNFKSAPRLLTERAYQNVLNNAACYKNLLTHLGKQALLDIILEENYEFSRKLFNTYDWSTDEMDYAAWCMASVTATTIVRWIKNDFDINASKLAQLYNLWVMAHWREIDFPQSILGNNT